MRRFDQNLWAQVSNLFLDTDDTIVVETWAILPVMDVEEKDPYTLLLEKIDALQLQVTQIQAWLNMTSTTSETTTSTIFSDEENTTPSLDDIAKRLEQLEKTR